MYLKKMMKEMHVVFCIETGDATDSGASGGSATGNQGKKKTYQRVEILKIAEPCPLIDPSQVVITQGEILTADPVLTPIGTFHFRLCDTFVFDYRLIVVPLLLSCVLKCVYYMGNIECLACIYFFLFYLLSCFCTIFMHALWRTCF